MRFLASLFALLAFAATVFGQSYNLPLTALSVSITQNLAGGAVPSNPSLTPVFANYRDKNTRYAVEIASADPLRLSIFSTGGTSLKARNCGSQLTTPTSSSNSYCPFNALITGTPGSAFSVDVLPGTSFVELAIGSTDSVGNAITVLYVVTVGVYTDIGSNMLTLSTDLSISRFNLPYALTQSQYTINYRVSQSGSSNINVPFYLAAQKSVTTIFVQECPGFSCSSCAIDRTVNPFRRITFPSDVTVDGSFAPTDKPQHGRYTFPAINGNNCVRIINQVNAGVDGTNEYTITISLNVNNCGAYTTCSACASDSSCGWCLSQFVGLLGNCQPASLVTASYGSATSSCIINNYALATPRWIYGAVNCITVLKGDPRISGLQGQDFQVHGTPNEYFNLLTASDLQVNSRFVFLEEASCDNFTTCFSHPGTYIDEIGFMTAENKVRLVAGAIDEAARVFINGKEIKVSAKKINVGTMTVTFAHPRRAVIRTKHAIMTVSQSDKFFNVDSALLNTKLMDEGASLVRVAGSYAPVANKAVHGLIGQTWRNYVYLGNREYEGEVPDYQVADGLWGTDFHFNLYQN